MTSSEFVIWLKGFTEACNDFTATPNQWDRIKEVLNEVQDYDDNPDISWEIEEPKNWWDNTGTPLTGTISGSSGITLTTTNDSGSSRYTSTVWNDQMGCWHYTNYPEGFGYYINSTAEGKKEKKQLND